MRATAGRDRLDYREEVTSGVPEVDNATRTDRARMFGAGVGYRFQPNLRIGLDVEFAEAGRATAPIAGTIARACLRR